VFVLCHERRPSLIEHWMPADSGHFMTAACWCQPELRHGKDGTTVVHKMVSMPIALK